jgi:hypothetical protein
MPCSLNNDGTNDGNNDDCIDNLRNTDQVYKRELMYNLKELSKTHSILLYIRNVLYILIAILIVFLIYNVISKQKLFIKKLIV